MVKRKARTESVDTEATVAQQLMEPLIVGALRKKRITEDYLAGKLKEELEAEDTKFFSDKGKVISQVNVIAWDVRQRARKDAHELRGDYPAKKTEISGTDGQPITVIVKKFSEEESGD